MTERTLLRRIQRVSKKERNIKLDHKELKKVAYDNGLLDKNGNVTPKAESNSHFTIDYHKLAVFDINQIFAS